MITSIDLSGGMGVQAGYSYNGKNFTDHYDVRTNTYGAMVGKFELEVELNEVTVAFTHISGLSTREPDFGLNMISIELNANLFRR